MDVLISSRRPPLHSLQWRKDFSVRQTTLYHGQDNRLHVPAGGSVIDEFFRSLNPSLSPPRRHELLRRFLEQAGARHSFPDIIKGRNSTANGQLFAIVDDRCDPCLQFTGISDSAAFLPVRQWGSEEYIRRPPQGLYARVSGMDAEMLYAHLNQDSRGFTLEFHLPHYILRQEDDQVKDCRRLRKHRLIRLSGQDAIYEAQLSLIVYGVDEFFWTACFCEDAYFRANNPVTEYLQDEVDGPSSGLRMNRFPIWDPRFYFLSVLVIRLSQITMEWTVLLEVISGDLDKHDDLFLEEDPSLRKTKEYTWILNTLRRLRNLLSRVIATLISFDTNSGVYFGLESEGALYDRFRDYFDQVRQSTAELATAHMVLEQRIEALEKLSDVLVNASSLSESIIATRQGNNIRLLTYINIVSPMQSPVERL
ncbi:hypothetical protein BDV06DRAFT_220095 [Aspergillus oleicola]